MSSDNRVPLGPVALIGAIDLLLVAGFAWAAGWIGGRRISGGDVTAALDYNGGSHPGYRRAHAKGLCFAGTFAANGAGAQLSSASAVSPSAAATRSRPTGATSFTRWR